MGNNHHILKNLHDMIRNASIKYMNEFVWQDIELTKEFKNAYGDYLRKNNYDVEFLESTAVITSSSTKYIYVPNQWFVIASYVVDVYDKLQKYKSYFKKVADRLHVKPEEYAKRLRDSVTVNDRLDFMDASRAIFSSFCSDSKIVEESASRLWRFATDYAWWSGQKTIDRGDFHLSVILNMLNLVNASQSYVGDIVSAYANDHTLRNLVRSADEFTVNMAMNNEEMMIPALESEIRDAAAEAPVIKETETIPKPERVKIKISESGALKEIKFRS